MEALRALAVLLRDADMAATDAIRALVQRQSGTPLAVRLQPLDAAVGALDFERALAFVNALIDELAGGIPA